MESIARGQVQPEFSVLSLDAFQQTLDLVQRAVADPKYLEKRHSKLAKLKEILADHFGRHGRAGSSTRALVFSQLRATVHEIKTEISEVAGMVLLYILIIYFELSFIIFGYVSQE